MKDDLMNLRAAMDKLCYLSVGIASGCVFGHGSSWRSYLYCSFAAFAFFAVAFLIVDRMVEEEAPDG